MHWDAKIPYCGRKECWERLVEMIDLAKVRARTNIIPFGPANGPRGLGIRNWLGRFWNPFKQEFQDEPVYSDGTRLTREEAVRFAHSCREASE
jgi:hypothetical protein